MTFEQIEELNEKNLVDYWKEHNLTINDFYCRCCGKFMLDLADIVDVGYNKTTKQDQFRLYKLRKRKQYIESETNRWLVRGRTLSGKTFFRHICWDCFFKQLLTLEDVPRRARKSSWYKDVLNGKKRPPATCSSPSKYFKLLFDITDEELEHEHRKFDTASLESFKRRFGEKLGLEKYAKYCKRQAYTCSKEYMINERGLTEEDWNRYNASRACTKENFVARYGEELGLEKWKKYCNLEAYVGCQEEYFIEKYGKEEGTRRYLELNQQKAQTLENFIRKYGEELGKQKFHESTSKQFSRLGLALFEEIQSRLGIFGMNAKYGAHEMPIVVEFDDGNVKNCFPDYLLNTKIIEFNGDYWHMSPKYYQPDELIPFGELKSLKFPGNTAKDIWKYDEQKKRAFEKLGYSVKVVWEDEYNNDKEATIQACVRFLRGQL